MRALLRRFLLPSAVVAGLGLAVAREHALLSAGILALVHADPSWIAVGIVLTCALWPAGAFMVLGSVPVRPPFRRLLAVQVAASFANHVLPAGTGGYAVNMRYLRRIGLTREAAVASLALNTGAGVLSHLLLVGAVLATTPLWASPTRSPSLPIAAPPHAFELAVAGAVVVMAVLTGAVAARRRLPLRRLTSFVSGGRVILAVFLNPRRALHLWGGAVSQPLLHTVALYAVLRALRTPLPMLVVLLVYLLASALSALVPSPGGVGALDLLLSGALVAAGLPGAAAIAALVGYRVLTVWLTVIPGAGTLLFLASRRII